MIFLSMTNVFKYFNSLSYFDHIKCQFLSLFLSLYWLYIYICFYDLLLCFLQRNVNCSGVVPQISVIMGPCAGKIYLLDFFLDPSLSKGVLYNHPFHSFCGPSVFRYLISFSTFLHEVRVLQGYTSDRAWFSKKIPVGSQMGEKTYFRDFVIYDAHISTSNC